MKLAWLYAIDLQLHWYSFADFWISETQAKAYSERPEKVTINSNLLKWHNENNVNNIYFNILILSINIIVLFSVEVVLMFNGPKLQHLTN